jgi:hypothetical protein
MQELQGQYARVPVPSLWVELSEWHPVVVTVVCVAFLR